MHKIFVEVKKAWKTQISGNYNHQQKVFFGQLMTLQFYGKRITEV